MCLGVRHTVTNGEKCKGWNWMTPKCTPILGVALVRELWMFRALVEKANKHNNKQWTHMLSDLQINKLDTPMLKHQNPYCSPKKHMHVNDSSQKLEIH